VVLANNSPYELLAGVSGAFIVIVVALGIALAKTREDNAKRGEWQRIYEKLIDKLLDNKKD